MVFKREFGDSLGRQSVHKRVQRHRPCDFDVSMVDSIVQWRTRRCCHTQTILLLRIESSRLHLLWVVVHAVWSRGHHTAHARYSVARLSVAFCRRRGRVRKLVGVDIVGHAILLVSNHVGRACSSWGRRRNSRGRRGHGVGLLCARDEHWHHPTGRHELRLRSVGWVVVAPWDERLRLVTWLEWLEGRCMNGALWNVRQRRARRHVARVRRLASVLVEACLIARCGTVDMSRHLLVERLLFLLLRGVEVHRGRRLYACNIDVLLGARLVHRQLALGPVLTEGWLLRRRVGSVGRRDDGRPSRHPNATRRQPYHGAGRIDETAVPGHDGPSRRYHVIPGDGRASTESNAGRVDTTTVHTCSSTRETSAANGSESPSATTKALLVGAKGAWDKDERSLDRGEDVSRC